LRQELEITMLPLVRMNTIAVITLIATAAAPRIEVGDVSWPKQCRGVMTPYSPQGAQRGCPREMGSVKRRRTPYARLTHHELRSPYAVLRV
jgi:hypothetical protein